MSLPKEIAGLELFAWVGEDELVKGDFGLKQGIAPAGCIPMVSVSRSKLEKYWQQAEAQADYYGKKIYCCKFVLTEVVQETKAGE